MAISFKEAENKMEDPKSEFHKITETIHLHLPPRYLGDNRVKFGVVEILNSKQKRFSDIMDGALIAFDNVKFLHSRGWLLDEAPYIQFDIRADFIVFRPAVGSILRGVVNKLGKTHIGCLVHQCFNASIPKPREDAESWVGANLAINDQVLLHVTEVCCNNEVLSMKGTIFEIPPQTKSESSADDDAMELTILQSPEKISNNDVTESVDYQSAKKKRKQTQSHDTEEGEESANILQSPMEKLHNSKRKSGHLSNKSIDAMPVCNKRKRKESSNESETSFFSPISDVPLSTKKKKKNIEPHDSSFSSEQVSHVKKKRRTDKYKQPYESLSQSESSFLSPSNDQVLLVEGKKKKKNKYVDSFSDELLESSRTEENSASEFTKIKSKKKKKSKKGTSSKNSVTESMSSVGTNYIQFGHISQPEQKKKKHEKKEKKKNNETFESSKELLEFAETERSFTSEFTKLKSKKISKKEASTKNSVTAVTNLEYIPNSHIISQPERKKKKQK